MLVGLYRVFTLGANDLVFANSVYMAILQNITNVNKENQLYVSCKFKC